MAKLDGVEAIEVLFDPRADGTAEPIKRMRREDEQRIAPARAQSPQIVERADSGRFFDAEVEHDGIRPFDAQFGGRDEQDAEFARPGETRSSSKTLSWSVTASARKPSEWAWSSSSDAV